MKRKKIHNRLGKSLRCDAYSVFFHSLNRFGEELWSLECSHIVLFRNKNACNRLHSWCNFFCAHFHYLCFHLMLFFFYVSQLFSVLFAQPVFLDLPVCLYFTQSAYISLILPIFPSVCLYFTWSVCISLDLSLFFSICLHLSQSVSIFLGFSSSLSLCLHLSRSVSIFISSLSFYYFYFLAFEAIRSMSSELIV